MRLPTSPVFVASLCLAACGGEPLAGSTPQDGATQTRAIIGPVDLTTAPATLGLTCPDAAAALAFKMPCLVGMNLAGPTIVACGSLRRRSRSVSPTAS